MENKKLKRIRYAFRIAFIILLGLLVVYAIFKFIPDILPLLKDGNEQEMEEYIHTAGNRGIFVIVALQVLQTITIVFPGIPIYMCAGLVYGKIKGTIICYLTYVISNMVIFIVSRRMGEAADELFPNKKQAGVAELLNKTKHPAILVTVLCVVPVIPNGIIPHIAAKSPLSKKQFLQAVAGGCIPGIFLFVCCGELIMNGYFGVIIAMCVVAFLAMLVFMAFKNKIMAWLNHKFADIEEKHKEM